MERAKILSHPLLRKPAQTSKIARSTSQKRDVETLSHALCVATARHDVMAIAQCAPNAYSGKLPQDARMPQSSETKGAKLPIVTMFFRASAFNASSLSGHQYPNRKSQPSAKPTHPIQAPETTRVVERQWHSKCAAPYHDLELDDRMETSPAW
jgi:hypothetical protein